MRRHCHRVHADDGSRGRVTPVGPVAAEAASVRHHALWLSLLVGLTAILLLAAFVLTARAENVDPYEILQRYVESIGGLERASAHAWMRTRGTLEIANLSGTVETWQGPGRLQRQEVDLGVFVQTSGDDGTTVWEMDSNGKVQLVEDANALARREVEARVVAYEAFDRDSDVFVATYIGSGDVDGVPCDIVRITNSISDDIIEMSIDKASHLALGRRDITPDMVSTTRLSDYREVDGILYPFEVAVLVEPPGQEQLFHLTEVEVGVEFDAALFAPPSEDVRDFTFASGGPFEVVPMRFHENHIFVLVEMAGHQGLWVLDSGASTTCIDEGFAHDLGLEMVGELMGSGAGSPVTVSFVELPAYRVGGISFAPQKCVSLDIAPLFEKTSDLEIAGILGYDFLSRFVTRVDYAREELTLYDPEHFVYAGDGVALDAALVGNIFTVPVSVDGEPAGRWAVDLGASGESFHYPFAEEHGLLEREGYDRVAFGAGGRMAKKAVLFEMIELAGFAIERPVIGVPQQELAGAFGSAEVSGNLGNALFRRFVLYLDYARQEVIFERGEDFDTFVPFDRSGLQIWWGEPGVVEVLHAAAGGPAADAGLADGDVITSINGIPAEYFAGLSAIRELLRAEPGTQYDIEVHRDGHEQHFTIELAGLLE